MSRPIRITFHHDGSVATLLLPSIHGGGGTTKSTIITTQSSRKQELEEFLNAIWNVFGRVTQVTYPKSYAYGTVTYQSAATAVYAYAGLKDPIQFQVAVQSVIGANAQRAEWAKLVFVASHMDGHSITPTWMEESLCK
jgi:hypothetical protein